MQKTFDELFDAVIKHEGYYANVKGDRGGETYMGVARNLHSDWKGWEIIDIYKEENGAINWNTKLKNPDLTQLVKDFYYHTFYRTCGINVINSGALQEIIFDWCVNSGRYGAKGVQRVLNSSFETNLIVDGIIGKITISAINECNPRKLFDELKNARIEYYHRVAKRGENYKFLEGWLKRINGIVFVA